MAAPIRFIHCADLHLGSRFVGISTEDPGLGKRMVGSTYRALDNIVAKANREAVDFVIFSGDIFDEKNETPYTRNYFKDALSRINAQCYIAYGNHDYERKWEDSIPLPSNAHVFGDTPDTFLYPPSETEAIVEIIGVSHSKKETYDNLTAGIRGSSRRFTIGVVHCDVNGDPKSKYSPVRLNEMLGNRVDYWALGHIHKSEILSTEPYVVYPGNTQGRDPTESGPKGAYLITVIDDKVVKADFFETYDVLWQDINIVIDDEMNLSDFIDQVVERRIEDALIRITVSGSGPLNRDLRLDTDEIRDMIEVTTGCVCTGLFVNTSPPFDLEERAKVGDFVSSVIDMGSSISDRPISEIIDTICNTHASNTYIRHVFEEMDPDELRGLVKDAMKLVVERMIGGGEL